MGENSSSRKIEYVFHSPQQYAKGLPPVLSTEEADFYGRLSAKTDPGQLFIYWNSEKSSHPGAFSYGNLTKGYAVGLSRHIPLGELCVKGGSEHEGSLLLSNRWFSHIMCQKIDKSAIPDGMKEKDMINIVSGIRHRIDGSRGNFVSSRYDLAKNIMARDARKGVSLTDSTEWEAGLYGHGHFAGLYKEKVKGLTNQSNSYYLATHSDSDLLGESLSGYASAHPNIHLGDFVESPQYEAVKSYSSRNAARILAEISDALSLKRSEISLVEDLKAAPPTNDRVPPEIISVPYVDTIYNTFYEPTVNGNTLVYYNSTCRLTGFEQHGGRIAMLKNAKSGISIVSLDPSKDYTILRHSVISGPTESHLVSHNNPHGAMPIGLGKIRGTDKTLVLAASKISLEDAGELYQAYHWSLKKENISFTGASDVSSSLDVRLYQYKAFDSQTKSLVSFMLGNNTSTVNLKPLSVILPSSEMV